MTGQGRRGGRPTLSKTPAAWPGLGPGQGGGRIKHFRTFAALTGQGRGGGRTTLFGTPAAWPGLGPGRGGGGIKSPLGHSLPDLSGSGRRVDNTLQDALRLGLPWAPQRTLLAHTPSPSPCTHAHTTRLLTHSRTTDNSHPSPQRFDTRPTPCPLAWARPGYLPGLGPDSEQALSHHAPA